MIANGSVDWEFIKSLEGKAVLKGYVPTNNQGAVIGHSGVTIASGVDLGQIDLTDLKSAIANAGVAPYPMHLIIKVRKYLSLQKEKAVEALKQDPLTITKEEADILDWITLSRTWREVDKHFFFHTKHNLRDIPSPALTVLLSLAYNFGSNLPKALPETWLIFIDCFKSQKWERFYNRLDTFPSKNPELITRRKKEAEYLKKLLTV